MASWDGSKVTALVTADLHLNDQSRDSYRHEWQKELRALVRKLQIGILIILGDLTDEKDHHGAWLVNAVVDHLHHLSKLCRVVISTGNHDYTNPNEPYFAFASRLPNVTWINNPTANGRWMYLPHTNNYKRDWQNIDFKKYTVVFAHQTFAGAMGEGGRKLRGIPVDIFPRGVRVISGDVHTPQTFSPITYVGAPYHVDFGDSYDPRVLLIDGYDIKSIPCHGRQKQLVTLYSIYDLPKAKNEFDLTTGDILKVRVGISPKEYANWSSIVDKVRTWADKNEFQLFTVQPVIDKQVKAKGEKQPAYQRKSDKELLASYGKQKGVDEKTLATGERLL